jgi:hypothetical protein
LQAKEPSLSFRKHHVKGDSEERVEDKTSDIHETNSRNFEKKSAVVMTELVF